MKNTKGQTHFELSINYNKKESMLFDKPLSQ